MKTASTLQYRNAGAEDLPGILRLLKAHQLPVSDIEPGKIFFIIALDGERIIGCIGIEQWDAAGLLRSFAVDDAYRNQQVGATLLQHLFTYASRTGIADLHLLTTTAETYFRKKGFTNLPRAAAPDAIRATTEFSTLCPASSAYMHMKTGAYNNPLNHLKV